MSEFDQTPPESESGNDFNPTMMPISAPRNLSELPSWPHYEEDEINEVVKCLRSGQVNYWNSNGIQQFEQSFAKFHDCHYGIALANGTVALELCLRALRIKPGDEVIVPCRTFVGSASAVALVGAIPVVADVDPISQNITADTIAPLINEKTKAIIVVHLAGWPCEMREIMDLADLHDLRVIEDCAQAHGARYRNQSVGSFGDMAAFSFCTHKIISTGGEGGLITTNSRMLWERAWSYKDHGKDFSAMQAGTNRYVHHSFGTNFRMNGMQAALGSAQLAKLTDWVIIRRLYADILRHYVEQVPGLVCHKPPNYVAHSYYMFDVFARNFEEREAIYHRLKARQYPVTRGICPDITQERAFQDKGWQARRSLTQAAILGERCLTFQVHPTLSEQDMHSVGLTLLQIAREVMCDG